MKKILFIILTFMCFIPVLLADGSAVSTEAEGDLTPGAKSAILIEASTNKVLYKKNENEKLAPASMTKIMSLLLIVEALENGIITEEDNVLISENAASMGGSQVYLEAGSTLKVSELLKAVGIASANDATVALAEKIGGSVENFVAMMNKRAKELGCKNTNFKNPHGLDEEGHYSTAYDMALMASQLVNHKKILELTSTYEDYLTHPNGSKIWLVNTNTLIRFYDGLDGLKTGFTGEAGYCLTATKEENGMRVISVVMKEETKEQRSKDTISLMEYAFSYYNTKTLISSEKSLGKIFVDKSENKYVDYYLEKDVNVVVDVNNRDINYSYKIDLDKVKAPLNKGDRVGTLTLTMDDETINYSVIVKNEIKKVAFFKTMINYFKDLISGNINVLGKNS